MIQVENLTKKYAGFTAVDDVSFTALPGRVTGFLGPNGAGKSTTMRMMVGLTRPDAGRILVGGHDYLDIPNPGCHVGVLLDASAQHAGRTGREVLALSAATMGLPKTRVDEMLALVSLSDSEAKRRVKNYSLGMRQRLGIANALMGDPQVLILDEPANGLDPAGIRWMRGLLKGYADRGGTVLLSSHLLHEVQMIADDLVMIGRGRIVAQGTPTELMKDTGTYFRAVEQEQLLAALSDAGIAASPVADGHRADAESVRVGEVAAKQGITLIELRGADGGLEDLFLELTAGTQRETYTDQTAGAQA